VGFRMRKSFKIAPGVRVNVSKSGVGASAGGRGARYSVHSSGRKTTGRKRATSRVAPVVAPAPRPVKPGFFAPKGEKALYEAVTKNDLALLQRASAEHPDFSLLADTIAAFQLSDAGQQRSLLHNIFASGKDPSQHDFFRKYIPATYVSVGIAPGVSVELPPNRDAVALTLAELHQEAGDLSAAIDVVEQLEPTSYAAVSLAELYSQAGQHDEVMKLTEGLKNEDDSTALLLVFRGIALRERGMRDGAIEAFKEALRSKSRPAEIRHRALLERATTYAAMAKKAQARKDLERIVAEDSNFPGVQDALANLDGGNG
jgi:tetratricopeptide (TPR) repeat protein